MTSMRTSRLDWEDYNMLLACTASLRSPDPNTQVGAYICSLTNRPISMGYNGVPRGVAPEDIPWTRSHENPLYTKYPYIAHAEKNAILNTTSSVAGAKLYVTLHPCNSCAIDLIQAGIVHVTYLYNPYKDQWQTEAAVYLLEKAGVTIKQHTWNKDTLQQNLKELLGKLRGG